MTGEQIVDDGAHESPAIAMRETDESAVESSRIGHQPEDGRREEVPRIHDVEAGGSTAIDRAFPYRSGSFESAAVGAYHSPKRGKERIIVWRCAQQFNKIRTL
jgi:hypothetical protein